MCRSGCQRSERLDQKAAVSAARTRASVTPKHYLNQFRTNSKEFEDSAPPIEEFLCLAALAAEVGASDHLVGRVYERAASKDHRDDVDNFLGGMPDELARQVRQALDSASSQGAGTQ